VRGGGPGWRAVEETSQRSRRDEHRKHRAEVVFGFGNREKESDREKRGVDGVVES